MKKLAVALVALGSLSGCVVYPIGRGRACYAYDEHGGSYRFDRDGDRVAARDDRHPESPRLILARAPNRLGVF